MNLRSDAFLRGDLGSLLYLSVLLAAFGCTSRSGGGHAFSVVEEDGIPVAVTRGGPKYEGELFEYEEILRLSPDPGHADSYLQSPEAPIVGADGDFFVNDMAANHIVVFDSEGRFLRTIGREGQGPGDLVFPRNLRAVGDTLHVNSHIGAWRLTRFLPDGSLVDVKSIPVAARMAIPDLHRTPSGGFLVETDANPVIDDVWYADSRLTILTSDLDTVSTIQAPRGLFGRSYFWNEQGRPVPPMLMQFAALPMIGTAPDHTIFITTGMEPVVRYYDLKGELRRVVRLELQPVAVSSAERTAYVDALRQDLAEVRMRPNPSATTIAYFEAGIAEPPFPPYKAFWQLADVDDTGRMWLSHPEPPGELINGSWAPRYRVLSPAGEYLGDTTWPPLVEGHVRRGLLLGILEDPESEERTPVIYRLHPIPRP